MAYSKKQIEETFKKICKEISKGKALRNVLKESDMPSSQTFYIWLDADEDKSKQYVRACNSRADQIFEDILDISDDQEGDVYEIDGKEFTNHNKINRSRLRVDSRKWMLGKLNPKKYNDKVTTILEGGEKPIVINLGNGINPDETPS